MDPEELCQAVIEAACRELDSAHSKIGHCVRQLSDEQLWWRERPDLNSIGNLILHLCGNLRQWVISGLGGVPDIRARQQEFDQREPLTKEELIGRLADTVAEALAVLRRISPAELVRVRHVQEFDLSGAAVIFDTIPHFRGHTQEIVYLTRRLLGPRYAFDFVPQGE